MTIREAREAAKRIRYYREAFPNANETDSAMIADFILDHFPEDGEEKVSMDWLVDEWGFAPSHIGEGVYFPDKPLLYYKKQGSVLSLGGARVFESPTRHQARQLFQALGIKKRGEA